MFRFRRHRRDDGSPGCARRTRRPSAVFACSRSTRRLAKPFRAWMRACAIYSEARFHASRVPLKGQLRRQAQSFQEMCSIISRRKASRGLRKATSVTEPAWGEPRCENSPHPAALGATTEASAPRRSSAVTATSWHLLLRHYLSTKANGIRCFYSQPLKKTCVRRVLLEKWLPPETSPPSATERRTARTAAARTSAVAAAPLPPSSLRQTAVATSVSATGGTPPAPPRPRRPLNLV